MALTVQPTTTPNVTTPSGYDPTAESARNTFTQQAGLIQAALANGQNPYGGQQNAIDSLYNTYGHGSGLSYQEAAGIIGQAYAPKSANIAAPTGTDSNGLTAADIASLNQSISNTQGQLNNLGAQQGAGNADINTSLNQALQTLLQGKSQAQQSYNQGVQSDKNSYIQGKNTIGANAGSTLNGLLRLLGSRGAGGGSAYNISAPGAVDRQASLQRSDLSNTFGQNEQNLNQNWGTWLQGYNDNVANTNANAKQKQADLAHNIALGKANLLQTLAGYQAQVGQGAGAYQGNLDQANQILAQEAGYQSVAPQQITTNAYQAPTAASYTTNPNATPTFQGQGATNDYFSPALSALLNKKQPAAVGA